MDCSTQKEPKFKIPKTLHCSLEISLKQKIQEKYRLKDMQSTKVVLTKYYPKYYHRLFINKDFKKVSVLSKVKQVKTVNNFRYEVEWGDGGKNKIHKLIRNMLQTKRKFITSPYVIYDDSRCENVDHLVQGMEVCHLFPRIKHISSNSLISQFETERADHSSEEAQKEVLRLQQSFWGASRYLKHLIISVFLNGHWGLFLQKLQSGQEFLSKLKTFHLRLFFFPGEKKPESTLKFILQYQELLKYVTYINFTYLDYCYYGDQVKQILDSCPKLRGFSILIKGQSDGEKSILQMPSLKSIQNVIALKLLVKKVWHLIEYFEFPCRLENLTLDFDPGDWRLLWTELYPEKKSGPAVVESSEKQKILLNFFEKCKQLTNLKSLNLTISNFPHLNGIIQNFLLPFLRSLPELENLEFRWATGSGNGKNPPMDLSIFLEGIAPLQQLKSVKLLRCYEAGIFREQDLFITFKPQENFAFPKIPLIEIDAWISPDFDFEQFFENIPSNQETKEINLSKINLNSISSFIKLLAELEDIQQPNPPKIHLDIILRLDDLNDIYKAFICPLDLASNITIDLKIYLSSSEYLPLKRKKIARLQNIFRSLKLDIIMELSTQSQYDPYKYIEVRSIPLLIRNCEQAPIKDLSEIHYRLVSYK